MRPPGDLATDSNIPADTSLAGVIEMPQPGRRKIAHLAQKFLLNQMVPPHAGAAPVTAPKFWAWACPTG
jgi:hypothetical protein